MGQFEIQFSSWDLSRETFWVSLAECLQIPSMRSSVASICKLMCQTIDLKFSLLFYHCSVFVVSRFLKFTWSMCFCEGFHPGYHLIPYDELWKVVHVQCFLLWLHSMKYIWSFTCTTTCTSVRTLSSKTQLRSLSVKFFTFVSELTQNMAVTWRFLLREKYTLFNF